MTIDNATSRTTPCSKLFALLLSSPMSRLTACLILIVVWALIYLAELGRPSSAAKKVTAFCLRFTCSIVGTMSCPILQRGLI